MRVTKRTVAEEWQWVRGRADVVVPLMNDVRDRLGEAFGVEVGEVTKDRYRAEVDEVFTDGDVAVNAAAYVGILRELDVSDDYPGFVVDEVVGRELAALVAGNDPLRTLAQATFHVADVHTHTDGPAGVDDLDAALAAGFQTRLPGWEWREAASPFGVDADVGAETGPSDDAGDGG